MFWLGTVKSTFFLYQEKYISTIDEIEHMIEKTMREYSRMLKNSKIYFLKIGIDLDFNCRNLLQK